MSTPTRVAGEFGLPVRPPASWDRLLEAAVAHYWQRRREQREAS